MKYFFLIIMLFAFNVEAVDFVIPEVQNKFDSLDTSISTINSSSDAFQTSITNLDSSSDTYQTSITNLEALADGKIYIGDSSNDITEVTMSGDITISNTGVTTIGANAVEESMIEAFSEGLNVQRVAMITYDSSEDGGTIGTYASGVTLPDNAVVTNCWYDVITTFESTTDAATIAINIPTDGDLQAAVAISNGANPYDAGLIACDTKGTDSNDPSTFIKTTAARDVSFIVAVENVTAGKLQLFLEYIVSE